MPGMPGMPGMTGMHGGMHGAMHGGMMPGMAAGMPGMPHPFYGMPHPYAPYPYGPWMAAPYPAYMPAAAPAMPGYAMNHAAVARQNRATTDSVRGKRRRHSQFAADGLSMAFGSPAATAPSTPSISADAPEDFKIKVKTAPVSPVPPVASFYPSAFPSAAAAVPSRKAALVAPGSPVAAVPTFTPKPEAKPSAKPAPAPPAVAATTGAGKAAASSVVKAEPVVFSAAEPLAGTGGVTGAGGATAGLGAGGRVKPSARQKDERRIKRLLRNRVSAQQARERKRHYIMELEEQCRVREEENAEIEQQIAVLMRENSQMRASMRRHATAE
eukprot:TRINITY_DN5678_c0_g4_i4.p1 TRINITY_DN5678_c0_g4~~TRINITY_DN5678_c0_g4_i4.p1  ORF type:complete len:327 (-),score=-8.21 TRINITY_DN5678_c0_g4_i4:244-1224(-)